jgi:hypothetical protein
MDTKTNGAMNNRTLVAIMAVAAATVAILSIVSAVPIAYGQATQHRVPCGVESPGGGIDITEGHSVVTPSGNSNLSCHLRHP